MAPYDGYSYGVVCMAATKKNPMDKLPFQKSKSSRVMKNSPWKTVHATLAENHFLDMLLRSTQQVS